MGALSANVTYTHDGDWLAGQAFITPKSTVASTSLSVGDSSVESQVAVQERDGAT